MTHEKYGSVVTAAEMIALDMLEAQRRTNELLEKMFVRQQAEAPKAKAATKDEK